MAIEISDRRSARSARAKPSLPAPGTLADTRKPLARARTLPADFYTSQNVFDLEQRAFFARMWLCMGREEDVPQPGSFITREVCGERILILRGHDDAIRAFYNVCRHRGSRLVREDCGKTGKLLTCPYHAWTYALDGTLVRAPEMGKDFEAREFPLRTLPLGIYGGYLFVNLDEHATALTDYLSDLPDAPRYRMDELRRGHRVEYTIDANWKLVCENYSECYHCALVHPQLNRITDYRDDSSQQQGECFIGGPMELNEGFTTMSMSGQRKHPVISGLTAEDHRLIRYFVVYPNLLLSLHPDYVLVHTIRPLAPNRSHISCEWLFTQEALAEPDFDASDAVEFWDLTNRQDWGLCERVQEGVGSRGYRPGPYQESESCVHAFDVWYAERMTALL